MRFTIKDGVDIIKSSPKSLLGYMMRSRKQLDELISIREIGSILVIEEVDVEKALT